MDTLREIERHDPSTYRRSHPSERHNHPSGTTTKQKSVMDILREIEGRDSSTYRKSYPTEIHGRPSDTNVELESAMDILRKIEGQATSGNGNRRSSKAIDPATQNHDRPTAGTLEHDTAVDHSHQDQSPAPRNKDRPKDAAPPSKNTRSTASRDGDHPEIDTSSGKTMRSRSLLSSKDNLKDVNALSKQRKSPPPASHLKRDVASKETRPSRSRPKQPRPAVGDYDSVVQFPASC